MMLEAIPTNLFATKFWLQQDNKLLGEIGAAFWGENARLDLEDGSYGLYRDGLLGGDYVLERKGEILARASKRSAFKNNFEVQLPDRRLELRRPSAWSWNRLRLTRNAPRFDLFDAEEPVGSIYPVGAFTRHTIIDLPDNWSLPIRAFLFWLAYTSWKSQSYLGPS
jgi:hypothetical protein